MFRKLFCRHEYGTHGFTYVKCKKCGKVKRNAKLASKLIQKECKGMIDSGVWDKNEVNSKLALKDIRI